MEAFFVEVVLFATSTRLNIHCVVEFHQEIIIKWRKDGGRFV